MKTTPRLDRKMKAMASKSFM